MGRFGEPEDLLGTVLWFLSPSLSLRHRYCRASRWRLLGLWRGVATVQEFKKGQSMVIVLMGVTGSGKTTIGRLLSKELGWKYYDADDFHPAPTLKR